MTISNHDLAAALALLVAFTALLAAAPRLRVPYPILLVLGGLALGFVPGVPEVQIPPQVVLFGILPPLLYSAAFFTSLRDLRANKRPIGLLSTGLVLCTTAGVAWVAHAAVDGLPWSSAFVLGAVVSPTDPLAATSIAQRFGIPRRIVAIVEGEGLVNDGSALVLYKFAVLAVVAGSISVASVTLSFIWTVVGGVGIGLALGWVIRQVRLRLHNPPLEITIALLTGYFTFIPAYLLGASGVLAVVTAGVYVGWYTPQLTTVETRLQGDAVWEILTFLLNGLLFVTVGLSLPAVLDGLGGHITTTLVWQALAVVAAVIVIRFLWVFPATYVPRALSKRIRAADPYPPWQYPALISWTGMRGAVSLAAALAIPLHTDAGPDFPGRDRIIYLTFAVILATLVGQGLTMPLVIRALGLEDDGVAEREAVKARIHAADAALNRIDELIDEEWVRDETAERLRRMYRFRRNRFAERYTGDGDGAIEEQSAAYQQLLRQLIEAERQAVVDLRGAGAIGDDAMRVVHRELDLEEARLDL
ncbi:MAG TPA: Na+/H+ antiporter [Gaiellales bacterium]|nr:Na+/H+ antiporter [Gaiellales bacterium]